MKVVIQRVSESSVSVKEKIVGEIHQGFCLLIGVEENDEEADADWLIHKIIHLRIFEDENEKMNLSIKDIGGEILCISQFTLMAEYKKGNRPSFAKAAGAEKANALYNYFKNKIAESGLKTQSGVFGADMKIKIHNDGPVTIIMDSKSKV